MGNVLSRPLAPPPWLTPRNAWLVDRALDVWWRWATHAIEQRVDRGVARLDLGRWGAGWGWPAAAMQDRAGRIQAFDYPEPQAEWAEL